jgi:hypothetical protein
MTTAQVAAISTLVVLLNGCGAGGQRALFNGRDLSGWHISQSSHHGQTHAWRVEDGAIVGHQDPAGTGGLLLTDARFRNVEVSLEVMIDFGCDSGLFLRSSEAGEAYQVTIDYVENGAVGSVYGEQLQDVEAEPSREWDKAWRKGEWNRLRARIEGVVPHLTVWINGTKITDWTDTANHAAGGAADGMIALQVHGGSRWARGGEVRFREITVKPL